MTTMKNGLLAGLVWMLAMPALAALSVTTTALPQATERTAYETVLAASGGKTPYTWSAVGDGYTETLQSNGFYTTGWAQGWQGDDEC